MLVTAGDNPDRLASEASFAHPCAAAPVPASSGRTDRHRHLQPLDDLPELQSQAQEAAGWSWLPPLWWGAEGRRRAVSPGCRPG
ncbi:hypothetical protein [Streptomyces sp. NPDC012510]|uniref:hypothetical protein n=1 Tax=Streptomyces sp. NPDC012510 TaxID=3364838 RepID=UPI0036E91F45